MKKIAFQTLLSVGMFVVLLGGAGCTSLHRDSGADYLDRPQNSGTAFYYTNYDVIPARKTGQGDASVLLWFFQFSDGKYCELDRNPRLSILNRFFELFSPSQKAVGNAKSSALYNLCEANQADQILGATFEYKITDYFVFSKVECTVKGFPAVVKGVRLQDKQPVILNKWQKIEYLAPNEVPVVYSDPAHSTTPGGVSEQPIR